MADMRLHGKTVSEIADEALKEMTDKYGMLGRVGTIARDNMVEWIRQVDRDDLTPAGVLGRCEMLVRQLLYDTVIRIAAEDNERCMDYVMERISDASGAASVVDRAHDLAKEYFDNY